MEILHFLKLPTFCQQMSYIWRIGRNLIEKWLIITRMHSSRMRTGRSLTVCWSLLPRGGGRCLVLGGWMSAPWGGGSAPGGVGLVWVGVCSGGVWSGGVCSQGVCSWGGSALGGLLWGGVCSGGSAPGGGISQHALRQTPLPPCGQTDACENITLAQLRCGR